MLKMVFVFNEEKARALGYTADACYKAVDQIFARYNIKPTSQGVYEGPDNQNTFDALGAATWLPDTDWFLHVIDKWLSYEDDEDPNTFEDCIAIHYKYKAINNL